MKPSESYKLAMMQMQKSMHKMMQAPKKIEAPLIKEAPPMEEKSDWIRRIEKAKVAKEKED